MSKGSESINELRKICQYSKLGKTGKYHWFTWYFHRSISIYITKLFLKIGISANQATLIDFFIGIIGCSFFVFGDPKYWIAGASLLYLSQIFDRVDGEIARYNNTASAAGEYWDNMCGVSVDAYRMACMTFGIYGLFHAIPVLIFGFIAVAAPLFSLISKLLAYKLELELPLPSKALANGDDIKTKKSAIKQTFLGYGRMIFSSSLVVITILAVAIIDLYFHMVTLEIPFIGSFVINARYIYIVLSGVSVLIVTIFRVYDIISKGAIPDF